MTDNLVSVIIPFRSETQLQLESLSYSDLEGEETILERDLKSSEKGKREKKCKIEKYAAFPSGQILYDAIYFKTYSSSALAVKIYNKTALAPP